MRQTLRRFTLLACGLAVVSFAVILINQSAQLVELAGRAHPLAGQVVLWSLLAFYAACVVVPVTMWLRLPRSLVPPVSDSGPEFDKHLAGLRTRLYANPRVAGSLETRNEIEAALLQLDGEADEITRQAAARVFLSTAVAQNGSLDALFVLGLQSKLVWEIAHVYGQRPSLRDLGWLYGNVVATAFVAGEIEEMDLSQQIQPVVQNALGAAAGAVPGLQVVGSIIASSIITGTTNAFLTLRVGVVARRYCGSLTRPAKRGLRRSAFAEAAGMLGAIASSGARRVVAAVVKASGRTVAKTATGIGSKVVQGAAVVGNKVRNGAGAMVDTLTFRRPDDDA